MIRPNQKFGFASPTPRERAFTLAELLIATGITVIIVVLLGTMFGSLLNTASQASQRIDAFREARAALHMIERDLSNLVRAQWNPDPFSNPTPTPGTAQPVTRPAAYFALDNIYSDPAAGNQQLYAMVAAKRTGSSGDVCAVGYYCRWDGQAYSLRRFFRNSADTFNVIQSAATYAADSVLYVPGASDAIMAAYVWNLKVTMYNATGTVIAADPNGNPIPPYISDPNATTPWPLPGAIEISFNAMSQQAARTVTSVTANNATAYNVWMAGVNPNPSPSDLQLYQQLIAPHTYQFRTRINFQ